MNHERRHIVIVGAGVVGLTAALALARLPGVRITLVERTVLNAQKLAEFDHRVYALTPSSQQLLEQLGVCTYMDAARVAPVRAMEIFDEANPTALTFETGMPLATMVEHANVRAGLIAAVRAQPAITIIENANIHAVLERVGGGRDVVLDHGNTLVSDLLLAADGAQSRVRGLLGIEAGVHDYDSVGVVANFACQHGHLDIARQWFSREGVLAYLPLPTNHISIVWSVSAKRGQTLLDMTGEVLAVAVAEAGQQALGALKLVSPVVAFPLQRMMVNTWVLSGAALLGDAAHTIHPLAGQGLNLGLADVRALAGVLAERSALSGIGDLAVLRRYARARHEPTWAMASATEGLRALFASETQILMWMRNQGWTTLQRFPALKNGFTDYASAA